MSWRLIAKRAANIREIRFLVPNGGAAAANSQGLRDFIAHQHKDLKMLNPSLNLPVREGFDDLSPTIVASYSYGKEKTADVSGLDEKVVETAVQKLVEAAAFMKQ